MAFYNSKTTQNRTRTKLYKKYFMRAITRKRQKAFFNAVNADYPKA